MKRIELVMPSVYQVRQSKLFAESSADTSLDEYEKRGQADKHKITKDIYSGKIAEFMVFKWLKEKGKDLLPPDLQIYEAGQKSFDADLISDSTKIHVKSHTINENYPISWLFQKKDSLVTAPTENDFIALVVLSKEGCYMYLQKAKEVVFKEPLKESLKESKVCVYET